MTAPGHYTPSGKFIPHAGRKSQRRGDVSVERGQSAATAAAKQRYLTTLKETCSVSAAITASGRSRWTTRDWIKRDSAFAEAEAMAREEVTARLEKEAIRRAVEGIERPMVSGGKIVTVERVYSDRLLKQLLAAADPERFARPGAALAVQVNVGPVAPYTLRFEGDGLGPIAGDAIDGEAEKVSAPASLPEATRRDLSH